MSDNENTNDGLGRPGGSNPQKWQVHLAKNKENGIEPGTQEWADSIEEFKRAPGWNRGN